MGSNGVLCSNIVGVTAPTVVCPCSEDGIGWQDIWLKKLLAVKFFHEYTNVKHTYDCVQKKMLGIPYSIKIWGHIIFSNLNVE